MTVLKLCVEPGCRGLTTATRCRVCQAKRDRRRNRGSFYQTAVWRALAQACIERDVNCLLCASQTRLTANHIIPRSGGGPDTVENLMAMCGRCHSTYEADLKYGRSTELRRRVDEIRAALIVSRDLRPQGDTA